jgi:hypothetical protein
MRLLKSLSMLFLFAWIAGAGSACAGSGTGGDTQAVDSFLHAVYAHYAAAGAPIDIDDAQAGTIYEASLLALMREDRRALQGEAGVLDADPLCACQDHDVRAVKWVLAPVSTGGWSARVSFGNLGSEQHVALSLVRAPQGWRIADVQSENIPSLRASLQDEIHAAAQEVPPPDSR